MALSCGEYCKDLILPEEPEDDDEEELDLLRIEMIGTSRDEDNSQVRIYLSFM
jgi:hypothetical protein